MTKGEALYGFFSRFGMNAYAATAVPDDVVFPYLTYDAIFDTWESGEVGLTVNLWFYTDSETVPNAKAQEISDAIGSGGVTVSCDGGFIWIKRGSPFAQPLTDDTAPGIKRRLINLSVEYMTET
jgi:hypothetical protein